MQFVILPTYSASGWYEITISLRFNSGSSDYLSRTFPSAGNRRTWTISCWIKRTNISTSEKSFFANYTSSSNLGNLYFRSGDDLQYYNENLSVATTYKTPINKLRDVSAWYHYVFRCDTTDATSSNRYRHYFNGVLFNTTFAEDLAPSQNYDTEINKAIAHYIGYNGNSGGYFSGYLADYYFIDGQALDPTSFGETDEDTGIWKPKAYTGTYGTNGFYLQFKNSASLGTDSSGNGNNFTVNNLTSIDQTTDTPTNNYCTMNPLFIPTSGTATFSEGNLNLSLNNFDFGLISTMGVSSGKWYWEVKWTADGDFDRLGVKPAISPSQNPVDIGIGWNRLSTSNGMSMLGTSVSGSWGSAFSVGDIIMFALDCDNKALYIGQNGTWRNSGVPTSGASKTGAVDYSAQSTLTSDYLFPSIGKGNAGTTGTQWNFGNPIYSSNSYTDGAGFGNFSYAVPSGYYALNTKNLATFG